MFSGNEPPSSGPAQASARTAGRPAPGLASRQSVSARKAAGGSASVKLSRASPSAVQAARQVCSSAGTTSPVLS